MAIFQIVNGKCHWRTPFKSLDECKGKFPPDCIFVDAPDYVNEQWGFDDTEIGDDRFIQPKPPEGWVYDTNSGQMMPEEMLAQALEEAKANKQRENNNIFANWLKEHPLTWKDGKHYGVTMDDQQEISLNLLSYQLQVEGIKSNTELTDEQKATAIAGTRLEWHAIQEACVPWTFEELTALSLAIREYIYPGYNLNQSYKTTIYACTDRKAVDDIQLDYSSLTPNEESGEETEPTEPEAPTTPEETTDQPAE